MTDHVIAPMHNQRFQKLSQLQVTAQYNYVIGVKKKNAFFKYADPVLVMY